MKTVSISMFALSLLLSACQKADERVSNEAFANGSALVEINLKDIKPAFTRNTVLELNAVVSKQLEVIDEFDRIKSETATTNLVDQRTSKNYELKISDLSERADENREALLEIKTRLDSIGENYNRATLAGMLNFVTDVKSEIDDHLGQVSDS